MSSFNRFADSVAARVAHPAFFVFCVTVVVVWAPSLVVIRDVNTWQLIINSFTTIVTFLLVALLHNTQHRFEQATNERLHNLEETVGPGDPVRDEGQRPDR